MMRRGNGNNARHGKDGLGLARCGMLGQGLVSSGKAWCGFGGGEWLMRVRFPPPQYRIGCDTLRKRG